MQSADVLHADPYPHTRLALVVIGQKDGALFSGDTDKSIVRTPSYFESQRILIVRDAGIHIFDPEDRHGRTEAVGKGFRRGFRHSTSRDEDTSLGFLVRNSCDSSGIFAPEHSGCFRVKATWGEFPVLPRPCAAVCFLSK